MSGNTAGLRRSKRIGETEEEKEARLKAEAAIASLRKEEAATKKAQRAAISKEFGAMTNMLKGLKINSTTTPNPKGFAAMYKAKTGKSPPARLNENKEGSK